MNPPPGGRATRRGWFWGGGCGALFLCWAWRVPIDFYHSVPIDLRGKRSLHLGCGLGTMVIDRTEHSAGTSTAPRSTFLHGRRAGPYPSSFFPAAFENQDVRDEWSATWRREIAYWLLVVLHLIAWLGGMAIPAWRNRRPPRPAAV